MGQEQVLSTATHGLGVAVIAFECREFQWPVLYKGRATMRQALLSRKLCLQKRKLNGIERIKVLSYLMDVIVELQIPTRTGSLPLRAIWTT